MFRIGEFSKMTKTTIKTLLYYDEAQLLKPQETDPFTGHRFYTTAQLLQLHRIQFILHGKEEEYFMNYTATLKDLPECIVYSKRMTIPSYDAYFEVLPALGQKMTEKYPDLQCAKPEYCFIVYLDGEYKEKDINVEYCEAVTEMKPDFDDIHFKKMASVPAVTVMHKGPYAGLANAYAFAFQWIEENGMLVADSPRESYIDGIWNKESEEDWLTELQIPIKKK